MDVGPWSAWSRGEGWGLLQSLPPYDEASAMALASRLRAAGFDADLVAAALTQSRLRARAVDKFGEFAGGMIFTADGLEQATRLEVAAQHAQRFRAAGRAPRVRPRLRHRRRRDGDRRARPAGQRHRRRRGDRRDRRGQPAALAGRDHGDRARGGPCTCPAGRAPGTPARGWTRRGVPRGGRRPRTHPARLQPRGDLAVVGHGAGASPATCRPPAPSSARPSRTPRCRPAPRRSGRRTPVRCSSAPCGGARSRSARGAAPWSCAPAAATAMVSEADAQGRRRRRAASRRWGRGCTSRTGR